MSAQPLPGGRDANDFETYWQQVVADDQLSAGDRLPSERQLAQRLAVSRSKVREMLKVWETEGRIFIRPGVGGFLRTRTSPTRDEVLEVLGSPMRVRDIFEVRRGLEVTGVRLATLRAREPDLRRLEALLARMQALVAEPSTESYAQFIEADQAFHCALLEATQNPLYGILFQALSPVLEEVSWNASRRTGARQHAVDYHRRLVEAIHRKNPELGAAVMELHLSDAEELLATALSGQRRPGTGQNEDWGGGSNPGGPAPGGAPDD